MSKRTDWDKTRARPNKVKTVTFTTEIPGKNEGLPSNGKVTFKTGDCPCSICKHKHQYQCEEADCKCCTSVCN